MLTRDQRKTILVLHEKGQSKRKIARSLKISRGSVREVIRSQDPNPPLILRESQAEPLRDEILELYTTLRGNLVRVHEELQVQGAKLSYPALTAFCRREGIGQKPKVPTGHYHFDPGQEMQHDTSPHRVEIAGKMRKVQTATAILCHSRMLYIQCYPRFRRFECKSFLTEALRFFGGAPETVLIDNTHVVVLRGTGAKMIPVTEMESFSRRFGFLFKAHEIGDPNRKGQAERSFHHFENNFLPGKTFQDFRDLNQQAKAWCEKKNASYKRHLKAKPVDLYALERTRLRPLPAHIPEPYRLHQRTVSVEGYVSLDTHRYSVPPEWIGRRVQVRETQERIEIETPSSRDPVIHQRVEDPSHGRSTLDQHKILRAQSRKKKQKPQEEEILRSIAPELGPYLEQFKAKTTKKTTFALRQLLRMVREYPRKPFIEAVERARQYGLYDLDRVETVVLQLVADEYFQLDLGDDEDAG